MIKLDIQQNSDAWYAEKAGKPSASNASKIVCIDGTPSKQREKYIKLLAAEQITGEFTETYHNTSMERGHKLEQEAISLYAFIKGAEIHRTGLCYRDDKRLYLCSPDALVGDDGGLEVKSARQDIQAERLWNGWSLAEHFQQIQMTLFVTGREWWDRISYCPGMRPVIDRYFPDAEFFKCLEVELNRLIVDIKQVVEKIK